MQEEIENRTVNLAISTTKLTARGIIRLAAKGLAYIKRKSREAALKNEKPDGRQTIQQLIGQNQGVTNIDISQTDLKGFKKYARKYGVDYAITVVQMGCFFTDEGQVQRVFQFSQEMSFCYQIFYRYHLQFQLHSHPPLRSFSHYIIFPVISGLCQQPQSVSRFTSPDPLSFQACPARAAAWPSSHPAER